MHLVQDNWKQQMEQAANSGWSFCQAKEWSRAAESYMQAVGAARRTKDQKSEALFKSYAGMALREQGKIEDARRLVVEALAIAQKVDCGQVTAYAEMQLS